MKPKSPFGDDCQQPSLELWLCRHLTFSDLYMRFNGDLAYSRQKSRPFPRLHPLLPLITRTLLDPGEQLDRTDL